MYYYYLCKMVDIQNTMYLKLQFSVRIKSFYSVAIYLTTYSIIVLLKQFFQDVYMYAFIVKFSHSNKHIYNISSKKRLTIIIYNLVSHIKKDVLVKLYV